MGICRPLGGHGDISGVEAALEVVDPRWAILYRRHILQGESVLEMAKQTGMPAERISEICRRTAEKVAAISDARASTVQTASFPARGAATGRPAQVSTRVRSHSAAKRISEYQFPCR